MGQLHMSIKNADITLRRTPGTVARPYPLCSEALPTHESCVAGQPPPLDQYKEFTDWVPFFYAPPQYRFCRAFDEWYYKSCVPATQEAREDLRDIAQKNGNAGSKKELTDQINGTFNRTEDACAGIDPNILRETADRCDTIVNIHKKNRIITVLAALIIVKGLFTVHAIRHIKRSWENMKPELAKVWHEIKVDFKENGLLRGAWNVAKRVLRPKRLGKDIGQIWNAREGGFREQVTDLNIFFAKLLEFTDSKLDRAAAIAKWNDVKTQKSLSAEKKFERFKEVIREEFGPRILSIMDELETDIVKELIFQSSRFERLATALEAKEDIDAHLLIHEISGPIEKLHRTLILFRTNTGIFDGHIEVRDRLFPLTDMTGNLLQVLMDLRGAVKDKESLPDSEKIDKELGRHDLRRLDSIVRLAVKLVDTDNFMQVGEIPHVALQDTSDILALYNVVQIIIRSFDNEVEKTGELTLYRRQMRGVGEIRGMAVSASIKNGIIKLQIRGVQRPIFHRIAHDLRSANERGWNITIAGNTVVLSLSQPASGERKNSDLRKIRGAVQGLHFAAVHFKFDDAVKFTKDLLERLDGPEAEPVASALTDDTLPMVDRIYSKFETEFYEEIFLRIGDYMGQLHDALKKEAHERLVEYLSGNITTVLKYAGYLRDNLTGFARLADSQGRLSPEALTPEWRAVAGKFWGVTHDIGNVLSELLLTVDSVRDGEVEFVKKFDLTNINGLIEAVKIINDKQAGINGVEIVSDNIPEIAIPTPLHVPAFRIMHELVTNAVKYADRAKPERKVMILHEIDGAKTEVINDDESVRELDDRKLFIVVADNGVGISNIAAAKSGERLRKDLGQGTGAGLNVGQLGSGLTF